MKLFQKRPPGSMFKRLFTMMTATLLFCVLVAGFSLMFFFVNIWKNDRLNTLADDALSLAQSVNYFYNEADNTGTYKLTSVTASSDGRAASAVMLILNSDGSVVSCSDSGSDTQVCEKHAALTFPSHILSSSTDFGVVYSYDIVLPSLGEESMLTAVSPVDIPGGRIYTVCMQSLVSVYLPYTTEFVRMILFTGLLAVLVSFLCALIVSVRTVKPVKKITEITREYGEGNFTKRINRLDTYSELSELAEEFNSMADNLAVIEQSRSNFVANVSHELKTPMTTISGFVDGILDGTVPEHDRERYLRIVSDEVKRLSRLVVAMLNMSKIEAGKLTPEMHDVELSSLICHTVLGFEKIVTDRDIRVLGLDSLENITVSADNALITQVIYNLFDNAVKFTPDGGTITFALNSDKKNAVIKIRNSGKGISPDEQTLIFDRFYKVDKSRGLDSKSFGMGLYIVKSIIELHHGCVSVNSEFGQYTEFVITLPIQNKQAISN